MLFTSNFAPQISKQKTNNKKKIFLKSFFIFILLLKNNNNVAKSSIFIKPKQFRKLVILRAPYRHKLARLHLTLNRYSISVLLKVKLTKKYDFNGIVSNTQNFVNLGKSFETVFIHQKKFELKFFIKDTKNFVLNNFNVIFVIYYFEKILA